jgi:diadenosine tetraphosphate (Ap4A) HIT family hydrolase
LLGEAIKNVCQADGLRRMNYEVLGNSVSILHGHVHPRYDWEPPERITGPVWRYPKQERNDPGVAYDDALHRDLRTAITEELRRLVDLAY